MIRGYCKKVLDRNVENMAKWNFVNKHYGDLPPEMYCHVLGFIMEFPDTTGFQISDPTKCTTFYDHHGRHYECKECDNIICRTHENVWHCLKCDLILCKDCFHNNYHTSHTSWSYTDYQI